MRSWNTDAVLDLFLESAEIARQIKTDPLIEIKGDRTPVSNADKAVEALLTRHFGAESLLGEETFQHRDHDALIEQLLHGSIWIVDPIDGTANFINRRPLWGISSPSPGRRCAGWGFSICCGLSALRSRCGPKGTKSGSPWP